MSPRNPRQKETKNTTNFLAPKKYGRVTRKDRRKARLFNRHVIVKKIKDQIRRLSREIRDIPREDGSITTNSLVPKKYGRVTRKDRRKARLFNRHVIVKKIKDQIRRLSREIRDIPREDESITSHIKWFNRLKEFAETSSADNVSLHQKTDRLRRELNEAYKYLEQFRKKIKEIKDNFNRYYGLTQQKMFPEYLSQINYLQNRVSQLESLLGIGTSSFSLDTNNE
ncbi:22253_t:CDS:2, partial [Cetraspora pellucida]